MSKLDLQLEPKQVITSFDMSDPLFEQKIAIARKEEELVESVIKLLSEGFGASVSVGAYNMVSDRASGNNALMLQLIIKKSETPRKGVSNMNEENTGVVTSTTDEQPVPVTEPVETAEPKQDEGATTETPATDAPAAE